MSSDLLIQVGTRGHVYRAGLHLDCTDDDPRALFVAYYAGCDGSGWLCLEFLVHAIAVSYIEITKVAPVVGKMLHYNPVERDGNSSIMFGFINDRACPYPCTLPLVE